MTYLRQPNGERAGQQFEFTEQQIAFILWWYAIDENGDWLYRHGARRLAKGSGKSPMAAVLAICEFLAPCRFDGWDPALPGKCKARPVHMPLVQICATSEAQTENTFRMVRALLPKGGKVATAYGLDIGKTQIFLPPEGTLRVVTSSASTLEGAEATFAIGDESEHWLPNNGGIELMATLNDNLAKSGSRMVETNNAWKEGADSVAESTYEAWLKQEEGKTTGKTKILYDARVAPGDTDIADRDKLRLALEHVYEGCWWVSIDAILERIYDPRADPEDSRRKYLNIPSSSSGAWARWEDWQPLGVDADRLAFRPGDEIAIGFDGSLTGDATVVVGCRISDGHIQLLRAWEPREDGSAVPVAEVDAVMERIHDQFDVVAMFCDVAYWESFVKIDWPKKFGKSVQTWAKPAGKDPQPFAYDLRGNQFEWTMAVELTRREILEKKFTHDNSATLSRHVLNAICHETRWGTAIRKRTRHSPDKIDAAVGMCLARLARRTHEANESKKKHRTGRVI